MEKINGLYLYTYHHDDERAGWVPIGAFRYPNPALNVLEPVDEGTELEISVSPANVEAIRDAFRKSGWEGDGEIEAMRVPPFFSTGGYSSWFELFHVKQSNNGTSFIASTLPDRTPV